MNQTRGEWLRPSLLHALDLTQSHACFTQWLPFTAIIFIMYSYIMYSYLSCTEVRTGLTYRNGPRRSVDTILSFTTPEITVNNLLKSVITWPVVPIA